jgi:hypothetical protein
VYRAAAAAASIADAGHLDIVAELAGAPIGE